MVPYPLLGRTFLDQTYKATRPLVLVSHWSKSISIDIVLISRAVVGAPEYVHRASEGVGF